MDLQYYQQWWRDLPPELKTAALYNVTKEIVEQMEADGTDVKPGNILQRFALDSELNKLEHETVVALHSWWRLFGWATAGKLIQHIAKHIV
jgi:hypothetical protein